MFGSAAVSAAYGSFLWDMCGGVGERRSGRGWDRAGVGFRFERLGVRA